MNPEELAWCVGLFEGEGSLGCYKYKNPKSNFPSSQKEMWRFQVVMHMVDEDVMKKFYALVQVGSLNYLHTPSQRSKGYQGHWSWCASGEKAIDLIMTFLPLLGNRRRQQAVTALTKYYDWRTGSIQHTPAPGGEDGTSS